jgi:hypothetical protein
MPENIVRMIFRMFKIIIIKLVRFQILTVASIKMAVFWVVAPCGLVEVYRHSEVLAASIIRKMSDYRLNGTTTQKTPIFNYEII